VIAGDNFFDFSLADFVEFFKRIYKPVIAIYDVGDLERAKRYGTVLLNSSGRVIKMIEKPENPETTLISTACYAFPRGIDSFMDEYLKGENNPDSPGYFISWLTQRYEVYGYIFHGTWMDIGNIDEYRQAFKMFYH